MNILLLGAQGQLGWELQRALAPLGAVTAWGRDPGDLAQPLRLARQVRTQRPDVIVNAAAYTAVDRAESDELAATTVNADAPAALAEVARDLGAWLLHYSTDYVFDGSGSEPRAEHAPAGPLGVYGRSKWLGEQAIAAAGCRHLIFRTSWVYAARGGNFVKTMLRLASERDRLTVIDDQIGAPTGADLLADVTAHALRHVQRQPAPRGDESVGTYHVVASGETSWHGYASYVIDSARRLGWPIRVAADAIVPIATRDYPTPAQRPLNSRLDTRKLQRHFGLHLPPWQQGVTRLLHELARQP